MRSADKAVCPTCEGYGQVGNDDGRAWKARVELASSFDLLSGSIYPVPCPKCGGGGIVNAGHQFKAVT